MKSLKALYQLKQLEKFAMKYSRGMFVIQFDIIFCDARGWVGKISLPTPQGENIKDDGFEVDGNTFYEAVDKLWTRTKDLKV